MEFPLGDGADVPADATGRRLRNASVLAAMFLFFVLPSSFRASDAAVGRWVSVANRFGAPSVWGLALHTAAFWLTMLALLHFRVLVP